MSLESFILDENSANELVVEIVSPDEPKNAGPMFRSTTIIP